MTKDNGVHLMIELNAVLTKVPVEEDDVAVRHVCPHRLALLERSHGEAVPAVFKCFDVLPLTMKIQCMDF